ncbi:MAG: hypothetical protein ACLS3M_08400 [Collinsella sp.]
MLVWRTDCAVFQFLDGVARRRLIVIFSPRFGSVYTGGLGMTGWIKIPGIGDVPAG